MNSDIEKSLFAREKVLSDREEALSIRESALAEREKALSIREQLLAAREQNEIYDNTPIAQLKRKFENEFENSRKKSKQLALPLTHKNLTHEQVCRRVGLKTPTVRGINMINNNKAVFFLSQTQNDVGYKDAVKNCRSIGMYDYKKQKGEFVRKPEEFKKGTINYNIFHMIRRHPVELRLAVGGKNDWTLNDSLFVVDTRVIDGILKMVVSGIKIPRPVHVSTYNQNLISRN